LAVSVTSTVSGAAYVMLRSRASFGSMTLVLPSFSQIVGLETVGFDMEMLTMWRKQPLSGM
jgi:hypothetical protein